MGHFVLGGAAEGPRDIGRWLLRDWVEDGLIVIVADKSQISMSSIRVIVAFIIKFSGGFGVNWPEIREISAYLR